MYDEVPFFRIDRAAFDRHAAAYEMVEPDESTAVRDGDGVYWQRTPKGQWVRYASGAGEPAEGGPTGPLDVPETYLVAVDEPSEAAAPAQPSEPEDPVGVNAVDGFARMMGRRRDRFAQGEASSWSTEVMADELFLVDVDGRVWTVGLASGDWFTYRERGWHREGAGPDPASLISTGSPRRGCHVCGAQVKGAKACGACGAQAPVSFADAPLEAQAGTVAFLVDEKVARIPERVAPPWLPPWEDEAARAPEVAAPSAEAPPAFEPVAEEPAAPTAGGWIVVDDEGASTCGPCGTPVSADAKFCPNCGAAQERTSARFCAQCGAKAASADAKFCESCGTVLPAS